MDLSLWEIILVAFALAMDALAVSVGLGLDAKGSLAGCAARAAMAFGLFQSGMTLAGWLVARTIEGAVTGWLQEASHWVAVGVLVVVSLHMLIEALRKRRATAGDGPEQTTFSAKDAKVLVVDDEKVKRLPYSSWRFWRLGGRIRLFFPPQARGPGCHVVRTTSSTRPGRVTGEAPASDASRGWTLIALAVATSLDALGAGFGLAMLGATIWTAAAVIGLVAASVSAAGVMLAGTIAGSVGGAVSWTAEIAGALVLLAIAAKIALGAG